MESARTEGETVMARGTAFLLSLLAIATPALAGSKAVYQGMPKWKAKHFF